MRKVLFLIALLNIVTMHSANDVESVDIIAIEKGYPFSFTLPNGNTSGLYVEFWELWSETTKVPINIILKDFDAGLDDISKPRAVHSGLFITEKRKETYQFSAPFFKIDTGIIYSLKHNKERTISNTPLTIAVLTSSFQADFIANTYPEHTLVPVSGLDVATSMLLDNTVDALVSDVPALSSFLARQNLVGVLELADEIIQTNTVHAAISENNSALLEIINNGINNIPIEKIIALEKRWIPEQDSFYIDNRFTSLLTKSEIDWLKYNNLIRLGTQPAQFPLGFLDENGEFSGLVGEYVHHVEDALSLDYHLIPHNSWSDLFNSFSDGKVDLISAIVNIPERANEINFTIPYFSAPNVIVSRNDSNVGSSLSSLEGKSVGIADGYLVGLIERDFPNINVVVAESAHEALEMVSNGSIDAAIDAITFINYEIAKSEHSNLIISSFTPYNFELSMAVRKGLEPLVPILNKIISDIRIDENEMYTNTWLPTYVKTGVDIQTILYWSIPILLFILLSIIFVISRSNRQLNRLLKKNKALARRIVAVQENERKNLSGDLHDEIGQNLTALQLYIQAAQSRNEDHEITTLLKTINEISARTFQSAQELMHGLRPLVLNEYGLDHALSNKVILKMLKESQITYHKQFDGDFMDLSDDITSNMYRIAQECITNACKYSKAENLYLSAEQTDHYLFFSIQDDGIGFSVDSMKIQGKGFGLKGIQDRVEALGGTYTVISNSNGTTYKFKFPTTQPY